MFFPLLIHGESNLKPQLDDFRVNYSERSLMRTLLFECVGRESDSLVRVRGGGVFNGRNIFICAAHTYINEAILRLYATPFSPRAYYAKIYTHNKSARHTHLVIIIFIYS